MIYMQMRNIIIRIYKNSPFFDLFQHKLVLTKGEPYDLTYVLNVIKQN